jgi:hypothetical protein
MFTTLLTVIIRPQDKPPKSPGSAYSLWLTEWTHSQPKSDNREAAQSQFKKGAQIWHTVSEYEKQVCIQIHPGVRVF